MIFRTSQCEMRYIVHWSVYTYIYIYLISSCQVFSKEQKGSLLALKRSTPWQTKMSLENQWLQDVFPINIVPFKGKLIFMGVLYGERSRLVYPLSLTTRREFTKDGSKKKWSQPDINKARLFLDAQIPFWAKNPRCNRSKKNMSLLNITKKNTVTGQEVLGNTKIPTWLGASRIFKAISTPQKFNIDTKNGHVFFRRNLSKAHHFGVFSAVRALGGCHGAFRRDSFRASFPHAGSTFEGCQ